MRNILFPMFLFFIPNLVWAQTSIKIITGKALAPRITTVFHKLGDDFIRVRTYQYGDAKEPFFISLHDDESTAIEGATKLLQKSGGTLIRIENNKKRNIRFSMNGRYYTCDPNRIFSRAGISQTLSMFGRIDNRAIGEIEKFANRVLQLLPDSANCIISLHNNTNGKFSVNSYLRGNDREKDAKAVHAVSNQDPDDIFFTTDSTLYRDLAGENYNTILQDNVNAKKDGSLSIYCGEKDIPYLNCETEHGKLKQYSEMIMIAMNYILKQEKKEKIISAKKEPEINTTAIVYNYKIFPESIANNLPEGNEIYFGEKKVGLIAQANNDNPTGKIEMKKDFPLYNNMDFYIFSLANGKPKIELRIDPTRRKELYDPSKATIVMKVMQ